MAETEKESKDWWDKLDIILKSAVGIVTALTVALVGFLGSSIITHQQNVDANLRTHQQDVEANLRVYTELMSRREEADTSLRKEMFNTIITKFLEPASSKRPDKTILDLEMLAYNFHDSLDLGPLFKDVQRQLGRNPLPGQKKQYLDRLTKVTRDVIDKQIAMLEEAGAKLDGMVTFNKLKEEPAGVHVIDDYITVKTSAGPQYTVTRKKVSVEALNFDRDKKEMRVRLTIWPQQNNDEAEVDALFWVGFFDFPMLDNVRLPQGYRCSIALREFEDEYAEITLVYFPSSRASLKEKPFYDEILYNLSNPPQRQDTNPPR